MNGEFVQTIGRDGCIQYKCNDEGILTIEIDTTKELGPSASGKSTLIASSSGNASIDVGNEETGERLVKLGLNLYY